MNALVSRRAILAAAPSLAAPMALLPASIAEASADTPLLALYRQWQGLHARFVAVPDEESDAAYHAMRAVETRLEAEPVTCLEDLAAKVLVGTSEGDFPPSDEILAECCAILAGQAVEPYTPPPADPAAELHREWRRAHDAWQEALARTPDETPETEALFQAQHQLGRGLEGLTATTAEGILGQLDYLAVDFGCGTGERITDVPVAFVQRIAEAVRSLA